MRTILTALVMLIGFLMPLGIASQAAASCARFTYRDLAYHFILVGKKRSGSYFYAVVENIGSSAGAVAAQAECGSRTKFVTLKRGQTHTFKVKVGSGNPLVRIWLQGSPYWIPAGTYPSKKGAFTIPTDSHPRAHFTAVNTTGHRAVLNSAMSKPGAKLGNWIAAPDSTAPAGTAHLSRKIPTTVRHVRVCWAWNGGTKVVLDAPMIRLKG